MQIDRMQIVEWFENPVTELFFQKIANAQQLENVTPRYFPIDPKGNPATADQNAMHNSYVQGKVDGLGETEIIKREMLDDVTAGDDDKTGGE